jgi:hemerythrin-like domain-containing protein
MLTATYSLVAIANEQNSMRHTLHKLHQRIRNAWNSLQVDIERVESAFVTLTEFDTYCHQRKVEQCLIPAIRRATHEADSLIDELEALSTSGMRMLRSIGDQLRHAMEVGGARIHDVCATMDQYCHKLLSRFAKEEEELFPVASRVLSVDEWFSVAEKFLSMDGQTHGGRLHSPVPFVPSHGSQPPTLHS